MFEIKGKRQNGSRWFITIKITSPYCGCMLNTRILVFEQEDEPTLKEIEDRL